MESNSSVSSALGHLARILSWVFHPFVLAGPTLWYATYATTGDVLQSIAWSAVLIAIVTVPLITFIAFKLRRGQYTDFGVSVREHRFSLFVFSGSCFVLDWVLFAMLGAPRILGLCFLAALLALLVGSLVTTRTKASIHAGVSAGCAVVLFSVSPLIGVLASLAAVVVGWARIYLHQHTLSQVILGWLIAVTSVVAVFGFAMPR